MVPRLDLRVTKWQEHCPGSTVLKYNHPSGRTSYVYVAASGKTINLWRDSLFHMMGTSNSPSQLERRPFQAMLCTAKRVYRARVWEEKGGQVFNNTYRRDNIPNGQLCVLYVSPEGQKFRSWKQCVRYMGEDPLASVSWKHLSSNGGETHPSAGGENYKLQSVEVEACAWPLVGNTQPSFPKEKGSLPSGDRSLVQKTQTLNVISSSSSSGESDCRKSPLPSKQAIISISSSKEMGNEKGGSSSSSSSSSEKSISPASSSSAYANGDFSSSSSEDLDDPEDSEINIPEGLIHLHSRPSQDSVEKPGTELVCSEPRDEDPTSGNREIMTRNQLRIPRLLTNDFIELEKDAANTSPEPIIPPTKSATDTVIWHAHIGAETASPAREALCAGKKGIFTEATQLPTNTDLEYDKKRKICDGERGVEQEDQEEGGQSLKTRTAPNAVTEEEQITTRERSRSSCGKATFPDTKPPEDESESHGTESSEESLTSLKELLWKAFEEAIKSKEFSTSSSKKKSRKESSKSTTAAESNCCCQGSTIIVVCPCRIRNYHK